MPIFVCQLCNHIENTALAIGGDTNLELGYWGAKVKKCQQCLTGKHHNRFPRQMFDPAKWEYESAGSEFIKLISEK